jgi:hypothetical protein
LFDENPSINGRGGLSSRTIGHAHRLLSTALKDGVASEQLIRNVAATKSAPKVADEDAEVVILNDEEVNRRRDRRDDGEQAPGAFIPHRDAANLCSPFQQGMIEARRRSTPLSHHSSARHDRNSRGWQTGGNWAKTFTLFYADPAKPLI